MQKTLFFSSSKLNNHQKHRTPDGGVPSGGLGPGFEDFGPSFEGFTTYETLEALSEILEAWPEILEA